MSFYIRKQPENRLTRQDPQEIDQDEELAQEVNEVDQEEELNPEEESVHTESESEEEEPNIELEQIEDEPDEVEEAQVKLTMATGLAPVSLTKFDGQQNADLWWSLWSRMKAAMKWDEPTSTNWFPLYLEKSAGMWYGSLPEATKTDAALLEHAFKARFAKKYLDISILSTSQTASESVSSYVDKMRVAMEGHDIPEQVLLMLVIKGLRPEVKAMVMPQDPQSFEDLLKKARMAEQVIKETNIPKVAAVEIPEMALMHQRLDQLTQAVLAIQKPDNPMRGSTPSGAKGNQWRNDGPCMGCGKSCISRNQCPAQGKTCYNCGKLHHYTRVCRQPKNQHSNRSTSQSHFQNQAKSQLSNPQTYSNNYPQPQPWRNNSHQQQQNYHHNQNNSQYQTQTSQYQNHPSQ
jgi:hypothetical protein